MVVVKFGGSILDGSDGVRKLRDEVAGLPRPLLLVVSAFADVTNQLEWMAQAALYSYDQAREALEKLFDDHCQIAQSLLSEAEYSKWSQQAEEWQVRLGEIVQGLSIVKELSPRTLDLTVHFGERLSSSLVAAVLNAAYVSATDILITNPRHRFARADIALSRERVEEQLKPLLQSVGSQKGDGIVVTEGYIGRGTDGEITTMGRESSDFSATLFGELLQATEVRIYTGVPGVLTADPKILPNATTISSMSYGMARELAVLGAKVLHPRTVRPVERANIPLTITDLQGNQTVIGRAGKDDTFSIAAMGDAALVSLELRETDEDLSGFVRELARTVPVIRSVQAGRQFRAVTAGTPADIRTIVRRTSANIVQHAIQPAALVSLVRERATNAADAQIFISAINDASLLSFWTDPNERSISALVVPESLHEVGIALHQQFLVGS